MSGPARAASVLLLALFAGCAPSTSDWCWELGSADPFKRTLAVIALGEVEPRESPQALVALLESLDREQEGFRPRVVAALARNAPFALPTLVRELPTRVSGHLAREEGLRDVLEKGRERLLPALLASLGEAEREAEDPGLVLLPWFPESPVEDIAGKLSDETARPRARARAARVLGELRETARPALPALFDRLSDAEPEVRREAARALDQIDPGSAVERWALFLTSPKAEHQALARDRLCQGFRAAAPALVADLGARKFGRALAALRALFVLYDCEEARADAAALPASEALDVWRRGLTDSVDDAGIAVLVEALGDEDTSVRCCAAIALGRLGPRIRSVEPALEKLTKSETAVVREAARLALQRVRGR